ncbi:MAG: hypothetical protein AAF747_10520 [Planctomycetota bacterium]
MPNATGDIGTTAGSKRRWRENLPGLDFEREAELLGKPIVPIVDVHTHVHGRSAATIYKRAMDLFGIERFYTQSRLDQVDDVRAVMGDRVRFIAFPEWRFENTEPVFREEYLDIIRGWHAVGARMAKLWGAPRVWEFAGGDPSDCAALDAPWRVKHAELAAELGMMFMAHIADPDTWFEAKWNDPAKFGGTKRDQYRGLEVMVERFDVPWVVAHMGGWPEDLDFLDGLLDRHDNLYLDTSATKWIVRELSKHPAERVVKFFEQWRGRVLFGSDIVTLEDHLVPGDPEHPRGQQASNEAEAFDLYASRYWAQRAMLETGWRGPSPIADADLAMIDPERFSEDDSPTLRGLALSDELLAEMYAGAVRVVDDWYDQH